MSNAIFEEFQKLPIATSLIGFEKPTIHHIPYDCTPVGADIFGWDNELHYCFIEGFGETVFCVNPEPCCDDYVYPLAKDFSDFLRLLLATHANTLEQIK